MSLRLVLLPALALLLAGGSAAQGAPGGADGFFARQGDLALTAGVFGPGGGGVSSVGARYWVSDRFALGVEVGEAELEVGEWDGAADLFPSYLTSVHTQSAGVWGERHLGTPLRAVSLVVGARAHAGLQSRDVYRYWTTVDCTPEPCTLGGFETSAREEAVTGGLSALVGWEVRVFRGLTVGVTSEAGLARTSARLEERDSRDGLASAESDRAGWHGVRGGRLSVSVYL